MNVRIIAIFLVVGMFLSCNIDKNKSKVFKPVALNESRTKVHKYVYNNDSIDITLSITKKSNKGVKFEMKICNGEKTFNLENYANLITLEDENGESYIPEGTLILDSITNEEYECDSTFLYDSDKLSISIGIEKGENKRLSLLISNSQLKDIKDIICTLHKIN